MKPLEIEYGELVSSRVNFSHKKLTVKVSLEEGETPEEILDCMKAFIDLHINDKYDRISEARTIVDNTNFDMESYNYKEAQRILEENKTLIYKANRIAKRVLIIEGERPAFLRKGERPAFLRKIMD